MVHLVNATGEAAFCVADFNPVFLRPDDVAANFSGHPKVALWEGAPGQERMARNASAAVAINLYSSTQSYVGPSPVGHGAGWLRFKIGVAVPAKLQALGCAGQQVSLWKTAGAHAYVCPRCERVALVDVDIYGSSDMAVVESGGGGANVYRRLRVRRRPLLHGRDFALLPALLPVPVPRLLSTNADGLHSVANAVGPALLDSEISFTGDDLLNVCTFMVIYLGQFNGTRLSFVDSGTNPQSLSAAGGGGGGSGGNTNGVLSNAKVGDTLSFYHLGSMASLGTATIAAPPAASADAAAPRCARPSPRCKRRRTPRTSSAASARASSAVSPSTCRWRGARRPKECSRSGRWRC